MESDMSNHDMVPCSYCGEMIKKNAKSCRYCGSDEHTGWSDETYLDGIDLGDDFDYDEIAAEEFSNGRYPLRWWKSWKTITGVVVLLLFLFIILCYLL